ncbi:hypothetical protein Tco_1449057 [Tanacetum coccineum]
MNPIATQQAALDNALVPPEKRLKIERCNARIAFSKPQREETYQVTLEALKLTSCYPASIRLFRTKKFVALPSEEELLSFIKELGAFLGRQQDLIGSGNHELKSCGFVSKTDDTQKYGALIPNEMINQNIKDSKAYKTYYDFATGKKAKRVKRPAKKSTTAPTACVVIRDTPGVSISKKKAPAKADRGKGIELLSNAALLEDSQLKKAIKKSKQDTHKLQASGSSEGANFESEVPDESKAKPSDTSKGTGVKLGVPDVLKANSSDSNNELWGYSEDDNDDLNDDDDDDDNINDDDSKNENDDGNDAHDSERTDSDDDDENPSFTLKDYNEKEHDEESLGAEYEKERKGDEEMTDADQNVSQEKSYEQVVEDAHVTLTSSQKTKNLNKALLFHPTLLTAIPEISTAHTTTAPPTISIITPLPQLTTPPLDDLLSIRIGYATRTALQSYTKEFEKKAQEERKLYIDVVEKLVKDIIKDEVKSLLPQILPKEVSNFHHPVLSRFELKKILLDKIEKSKSYQAAPEHRELYDGLVKSYNLDKDLFSSYGNDTEMPQDQGGDTKDQSNVKSLPLIKAQGRQVVPANYFFNNDLEYLKGRSSSRKYTTSTTKTKAAKYGFQYGVLENLLCGFCCFSVSKELSNLEIHVIFDLNVELRMFTRRIVILKLVEDLQLGFESYQKKLNITKPETFRSGISKRTPYTAYKNPQGIIYQDKLKRNRLMRSDELYKFCDGTLISIRWVLYDIDSKLSMIYLPKRR